MHNVKFPSPDTTTSQETVALYMAQRQKEKYTVWVANVGLHDMKLLNMTTQLYFSNVRTFQRLLLPHCSAGMAEHVCRPGKSPATITAAKALAGNVISRASTLDSIEGASSNNE
jgi:hypothetical protein